MAKNCQITTEYISRIWNDTTGMCYEVMPDEDGVGLVQINVYSEGVRGKEPDTTLLLLPEEAEAMWAVLRDATIQARAAARQIEEDIKNG